MEIVINQTGEPRNQEKQTEEVKINDNGFTNSLTIWQMIPIVYATLMIVEIIIIIAHL